MSDFRKSPHFYTVLLLLAALIWGTGFIATRISIDAAFSTLFILLIRFGLASVILGIAFRKEIAVATIMEVRGGVFNGVLLFGGFILQTWGLVYTTPSNNAFISSTSIVLVPFLYWIFYHKRPPAKAFVGAVLCFLGVWVLSWQPGAGLSVPGKGELLTLLSTFAYAGHIVGVSHFAVRCDNPRNLTFFQMLTGAVLGALFFLLLDRDFTQFRPVMGHLTLVYLAVFTTCVAYMLQTIAQKHVSAPKAAVIIALESPFASMFSVLMGYDVLGPGLIVGGGLVLLSVLVVELDLIRLFRRAPKEE